MGCKERETTIKEETKITRKKWERRNFTISCMWGITEPKERVMKKQHEHSEKTLHENSKKVE